VDNYWVDVAKLSLSGSSSIVSIQFWTVRYMELRSVRHSEVSNVYGETVGTFRLVLYVSWVSTVEACPFNRRWIVNFTVPSR